jgi:hypothetical protein
MNMPQQYRATYENATRAQKAIEAIRLKFNNKKPAPPRSKYEELHPAARTTPCDCCGKTDAPQKLTKIDSGQQLCSNCLAELRLSR